MTVERLIKLYRNRIITQVCLRVSLIELMDGEYTVRKILAEIPEEFKSDFLNEIERIYGLRNEIIYWPVSSKVSEKIRHYFE